MNQMNKLLHASFDRFPRMVESRYDEAFLYLSSRSRKRSLVVLITNVIDEVNSDQIEQLPAHRSSAGICRWRCCCAIANFSMRPMCRNRRAAAIYRAAAAAEILTLAPASADRSYEQGRVVARRFPGRTDRPAGESLPGYQGPALAVVVRTFRVWQALTVDLGALSPGHWPGAKGNAAGSRITTAWAAIRGRLRAAKR